MTKLKPEDQLRVDTFKILERVEGLNFERVENEIESGTPDLAYTTKEGVNGWVELKVHTPKKNELLNIGKVSHWTPLQREFMRDRKNSTSVFMILRIGDFDILMGTDILFTFEHIPFYVIRDRYRGVFPNNKKKYWTVDRLDMLNKRLNGNIKPQNKKEFN